MRKDIKEEKITLFERNCRIKKNMIKVYSITLGVCILFIAYKGLTS